METQDSPTTRLDHYIEYMLPWSHGHQAKSIRDFVQAIITTTLNYGLFSLQRHWFRLMSDPHERFGWTTRQDRDMLLRRVISLSLGGEYDIAPHAMSLLSREEHR